MQARWYVGYNQDRCGLTAFRCICTPTRESHGRAYFAVMGPFRTQRAARFMERYGSGNPHIYHVDDAERLALQDEAECECEGSGPGEGKVPW